LKQKLALVAIESDPPGAAVYVDRKELGQFGVTPLTLAVPEGEHQLILERAGYAPATLPVTAKAETLVPVSTPLNPLYGKVSVSVAPASAELAFVRDGVPVAAIREGQGFRLPAGQYRVVATAPGYLPAEATLLVRENVAAALDIGLAPVPRATGRLLVSTRKHVAELYLDGRRVAVTPVALDDVAVGEHLLEVRSGALVSRKRIRILKGRATYIAIDFGGQSP
jgi:hypothetical protein